MLLRYNASSFVACVCVCAPIDRLYHQIVSPHDAGITAAINNNLELWPEVTLDLLKDSAHLHDPTQALADAYYAAVIHKCSFTRSVAHDFEQVAHL
jgi:hypothetical protein